MLQNNLLEKLNNYEVVLGSSSPRRRELLEQLGIEFRVDTSFNQNEEAYPTNIECNEIPQYLAEQKSLNYKKELTENQILITADTLVILDNIALGKPANKLEAIQMLQKLSGKIHQVVTGVAIRGFFKTKSFNDISEVEFASISNTDIEWYIDNFKPFDKAGSYGIQEWIGVTHIKEIKGSFYNIMGLPTEKLYRELLKF